jgi:rhodanese-related sulfurtransferase
VEISNSGAGNGRPEPGEVVPGQDLVLLPIAEVLARQDAGAVLLDVRGPAEFTAGHVRGAVSIGLRGRFEECAGAVLPLDRDVVLAGDAGLAAEAAARLGGAGYDRVAGQLDDLASVLAAGPGLVEASSRLSIEQLAELQRLEPALQLVDVRDPAETACGTLPGAREIPLASLSKLPDALDRSAPVLVYSAGGYRSLVAASVLQAAGFADVADLIGGYRAWEGAGLRVVREAMPEAPAAPEVAPRAAAALVGAGALLIDVREPSEWQAGHVAQALLLPMGQVARHRSDLPQDRRIVVVCRSGGRSAAVAEALRAWGVRRGQPVRGDDRVGGGWPAGGHHRAGQRRPGGAPRPPAELRNVDPGANRRGGHAQCPVLRAEPLRHPPAGPAVLAARGHRPGGPAAAAQPA